VHPKPCASNARASTGGCRASGPLLILLLVRAARVLALLAGSACATPCSTHSGCRWLIQGDAPGGGEAADPGVYACVQAAAAMQQPRTGLSSWLSSSAGWLSGRQKNAWCHHLMSGQRHLPTGLTCATHTTTCSCTTHSTTCRLRMSTMCTCPLAAGWSTCSLRSAHNSPCQRSFIVASHKNDISPSLIAGWGHK